MARKAISRTALWAIIAVVIIVVVVGGVAAYYATRPPPPKTTTTTTTPTHAIVGQITIGMMTSLTGMMGSVGPQLLWGAQLAINQINSGGGIYLANGPNGPGNYTLNLAYQDDQSSASDAPTAVTTLVTADHAVVVLEGPYGTADAAAEPVLESYNVPFIAATPNIMMTSGSDYNVTLNPANKVAFLYQDTFYSYGVWRAEFLDYIAPMINPSGPIKVVAIKQTDDTGAQIWWMNYTIYQNGWQNKIQLVDVVPVPPGTTDVRTIMAEFATYNPNVLTSAAIPPTYVAMVTQGAALPQLKGASFLFEGDADDPSFYGPAGQDAAGTFILTPYATYALTSNATVNAKWTTFRNEFEAATGHVPGTIGASGYDMVWIVAYALHDAGTTNGNSLINALETMSPPPELIMLTKPTPQGTLFDQNHLASFQDIAIEAFWNSTSQSVYTQVVWPPQYATASPVFGIYP